MKSNFSSQKKKNADVSLVNEPRDAAEYFEKILHLASPAASKVKTALLSSEILIVVKDNI